MEKKQKLDIGGVFMKMVILDALETRHELSEVLLSELKNSAIEPVHFKLKDMLLQPCSSCGSCGLITPGKCVIKDDIGEIMKEISTTNGLVFLTPIRWGGYSANLKKVIDRFMLLGLPLYMYKDGHLLHPMRYDMRWLVGVGILEKDLPNQEKNFEKLVSHNALNMILKHKTFIIDQDSTEENMRFDWLKVLKEVTA